jgi:hypothetical protein
MTKEDKNTLKITIAWLTVIILFFCSLLIKDFSLLLSIPGIAFIFFWIIGFKFLK